MCKPFQRTRAIMKVLGIDPGFDRLGLAVVEGDPSRPTLIWSACIEPEKGAPQARLARVSSEITAAIKKYRPDVVALETLFFSTNKKTALKVAEARGAILSAAGATGVRVSEYSPAAVKIAVTGDGRADKAAIARMIPKLVALPPGKHRDDELDAIAVGICALANGRLPH